MRCAFKVHACSRRRGMRYHVQMFITLQLQTQRAASSGAVWRGARSLAGPRGNGAARVGIFITLIN